MPGYLVMIEVEAEDEEDILPGLATYLVHLTDDGDSLEVRVGTMTVQEIE